MVPFGRDASIFHQQCLAHGIQIAILDVLYKNKENCQSRVIETEVDENNDTFASDDDDEDDNDEKVCKIVKVFRKSPTKNDLLQKYVKEEMIGETYLILDCRTRWNSLADIEYRRLADLSREFETLKATVEELCKRTASLIPADTALQFMFTKLDAIQHELVARELVTSLKRKVKEQRLLVASTLNYLHNPKTYFDSTNEYCDVFLRPDCTELSKHIVDVVKPKEKFNMESTHDVTVSAHHDLPSASVGKYLSMAYNNLISIPPTSVESERAFSSSGYLCNHLRSRLSDKSLDTLLFLRSHYKAQP
ncbi:hypothetical protein ABMA28_009374 [Loxostege sticticalis]|uniref:HAT C-terminal dimerisation domain-containing protein n=1 Tax=Loxostege sticticalis TaxID=481309 RepID=A0ABD0SD40_LOXSC